MTIISSLALLLALRGDTRAAAGDGCCVGWIHGTAGSFGKPAKSWKRGGSFYARTKPGEYPTRKLEL